MCLKEFIVRCSRDKVKEKSAVYREECRETIVSYLITSGVSSDIAEPPVQPAS